MKRHIVVSLFGSLVGFGMLLILLSATGSAGARGAAAPRDQAGPDSVSAATPLTSTFTYQGQLKNGGNAVNGSCQMAFRLYDDPAAGDLIGSSITTTVPVANGLFTVGLNFGSNAFDGSGRWLDIQVNCGSGFTPLTPRQALTPAPYALAFGAPGGASGYLYDAGAAGLYPTIGFNTYGAPAYRAGVAGYGGVFQFQNGDGSLNYYSGSYAPAGQEHATTPRFTIQGGGNVGIGTSTPSQLLEVNGITSLGLPGSVYGYRVGGVSGPYYPTIGFNTYGPSDGSSYLAGVTGYGGIFQFQNSDGKLIYYTGSDVSAGAARANAARLVINNSGDLGIGTTNPLAKLDVNGGIRGTSLSAPADLYVNATGRIALRTAPSGQYTERVTILDNGNVGIGTTNPVARLDVRQSGGGTALAVYDDGTVAIGTLNGQFSTHACLQTAGVYTIRGCSSAAEYVPSIDGGKGYPETADLVSIVPAVANPYGDTHSPFTVQKSTTPCDTNLLGFIVKPESGADGPKLNDHYLPLAIYGYFPAKVTLENGAIRRGDALTSSSKPGYGMKATGACKIIGYALEDADHEGTIQVFANHGENAAPEVAALRTQVQELKQTVADLKQENTALDARLTALEQALSGQTQAQSVPTPMDKRGSQ